MGTVDKEGVVFPAADDAAILTDSLLQPPGDAPEHFISVRLTVALIDHMKVIDIYDNGVHGQVSVMGIKLICIVVEIIPVIEVG